MDHPPGGRPPYFSPKQTKGITKKFNVRSAHSSATTFDWLLKPKAERELSHQVDHPGSNTS